MRDALCDEIARMVNLVAFDACDLQSRSYIKDVDPLKFAVQWRLVAPIPDMLHTPLRKMVRDTAARYGFRTGKITFSQTLHIDLYGRHLRGPAYVHDVSPQDGF